MLRGLDIQKRTGAEADSAKPRRGIRRKSPVLTFKPDDSVGYLLRMTSRAFTRAFQVRIEQDGITIGMWYYLRALWEEDGLTQSELSQKVETMDPSTGSALRKMERLGLIYRSADRKDRRKWHIFLTDKAKKNRGKYLRHSVELQDFVKRILTSKEEIMLRAILKKLRESLKNERRLAN